MNTPTKPTLVEEREGKMKEDEGLPSVSQSAATRNHSLAAPTAEPSAAGFTPAPWTYEGPKHSLIVWAGTDLRVCFMTSDGPCEANARLIAAAPDLLRQLEFAVAILEEARFRLGYAEGSLGQIEIDEAIDDGYAAIARALGTTDHD